MEGFPSRVLQKLLLTKWRNELDKFYFYNILKKIEASFKGLNFLIYPDENILQI